MEKKAQSKNSFADAEHISIAMIHHIDYLLTWNMTHIANPIKRQQIIKIVNQLSYSCPVILTPEEFLRIKQ
ncbi:MAG: hypothetical protein LBE12_10530 [Planctomycetaceae bacterium]|jgi:hypothetical protein|nr:hypothetical protein [Planctomycetaceae bacterium]